MAAQADGPAAKPALVIDLDGTLVRSDTLIAATLALFARPRRMMQALAALRHGRARFKQAVAAAADLDPALLPYNAGLLAYLRNARQGGRRLILATAADRRIALAVAEHLGLFDAVLASDGIVNLKGRHKLAAIRQMLGGEPFVYAGNERADLPVWRAAAGAICVNTNRRVARAAAAAVPIECSFAEPLPWPAAVLDAVRRRRARIPPRR